MIAVNIIVQGFIQTPQGVKHYKTTSTVKQNEIRGWWRHSV